MKNSDNQNQAEPIYHFRLWGKIKFTETLTEFLRGNQLPEWQARRMDVCREGEGRWVPLSSLIDFSGPWRLGDMPVRASIPAALDHVHSQAGSDQVYYFRLKGKVQPTRTLTEFRGDSLVPFWEARKMEVCPVGGTEWAPLSGLIDFSRDWRIQPGSLAFHQARAAAAPDTPGQLTPLNGTRLALWLLLAAGLLLVAVSLGMETSVANRRTGEAVHNLSLAQRQTVLLILGAAALGTGTLALVLHKTGHKSTPETP